MCDIKKFIKHVQCLIDEERLIGSSSINAKGYRGIIFDIDYLGKNIILGFDKVYVDFVIKTKIITYHMVQESYFGLKFNGKKSVYNSKYDVLYDIHSDDAFPYINASMCDYIFSKEAIRKSRISTLLKS